MPIFYTPTTGNVGSKYFQLPVKLRDVVNVPKTVVVANSLKKYTKKVWLQYLLNGKIWKQMKTVPHKM